MSMITPTVTALHWLPTAHPEASTRQLQPAARPHAVDMTRNLRPQPVGAATPRTRVPALRIAR
jgi:hypothetical protein